MDILHAPPQILDQTTEILAIILMLTFGSTFISLPRMASDMPVLECKASHRRAVSRLAKEGRSQIAPPTSPLAAAKYENPPNYQLTLKLTTHI